MCLILRKRGYHFGKFDVYYPWDVMNYLLELQRNPNAEIKEIFETIVIKWFDDSDKKWNRNELFDAVWSGDSEKLTSEMTTLLRKTMTRFFAMVYFF